jgi:predicted dehydrogenase
MNPNDSLRFAIFGAGFWSHYQLAAWKELEGVECVAIYNRTGAKAEALAKQFGVLAVYDDAEELLRNERIDFLDIITDVESHSRFVHLAAKHRLPVICQKPMAPSLGEAERMVESCKASGVPLMIHENWRWQTPIRSFQAKLREIGTPFRARIDMISGFPVFENQPFLKELEEFILTDMGTHILDTARFLFGEARTLYCHTSRIHKDIGGEDVATVMLGMGGKEGAGPASETTVLCQMAYAGTPLERECFPQTLIFAEGDRGSLELGRDYWVRLTTERGTWAKRYPPPRYPWVNPAYEVVQASIVACNADLLGALQKRSEGETTGEDNLKTLRLVFAAYESARQRRAIEFGNETRGEASELT